MPTIQNNDNNLQMEEIDIESGQSRQDQLTLTKSEAIRKSLQIAETRQQEKNGKTTEAGSIDEERESIESVLTRLKSSKEYGLSSEEAKRRLETDGPNMIDEKKVSPIIQFLLFMWNPLSWAMEVAAIVSIILGDYVDFGLILALLILNASIGYWEEHNANNAIEELKSQLAPEADVKRDGSWKTIDAKDVVAGDIVRLKLGDIINADGKVVKISGSVKIDQAALTGESFPVGKTEGDIVFSGSGVKQGDLEIVVTFTGSRTFYGRAAKLIEEAEEEGHFQKVLRTIGFFCIMFISVFVFIEIMVQFVGRNKPCNGVHDCKALENVIVLIVGGVPIAMPTVLSVTMALGAYKLSKKKAIVSRLTAVEELAGMDVLCSDKTGTLTMNQLTVDVPYTCPNVDPQQVIFDAVLASKREGGGDALEDAIFDFLQDKDSVKSYSEVSFVPFNSESKRSESVVKTPEGRLIKVTKGAPQIVLELCLNKEELREEVEAKILEFASRGFRSLAVARSENAEDDSGWMLEGMIPLSDPPRHDTRDTILKAQAKGIRVKMITGDHQVIAKEVARRIGMGDNIYDNKELLKYTEDSEELYQMIENGDGFAGVLPESKYNIVKALQQRKHTVGMTGDGANDAPALKRADIGIAVSGATGAARAAADIVLLSPGLGVITDAVLGSRTIFQRMKTYSVYAITTTVRLVLTFFILTVAWDFHYPTLITVILAIFNDGTIMTIAKDRVLPSEQPDKWHLKVIFGLCLIMGSYLTASTLVLFTLVHDHNVFSDWFGLKSLSNDEQRGLIYLTVSITGLGTIFSVRTKTFFWTHRPGILPVIAFIVSQAAATFIAVYGFHGYMDFRGCGWGWALLAWVWSLIWLLPIDLVKISAQWILHRLLINEHGGAKWKITSVAKYFPRGARMWYERNVMSSHYQFRPHIKTSSKSANQVVAEAEHRRSVQLSRPTSIEQRRI